MAAVSAATQLETLLSLQRDLALETDIDKVLTRIVQTASQMLVAERATLFVIDHQKNELWSRVLTEGTEPGVTEVREIRLPLDGRSLAAEAARGGSVMRIDAPYEDPRFDPSTDQRTGFRTRSILIAPIDARDGRRLGVLQVLNHHGGAFDEADEGFARSLAGSAGIALEYVQLSRELADERLRVVKVAEEERKRLARDLHDGVAQMLANAAIGIEIASKRAKQDPDGALRELWQLREKLVESQRGLRDILFALRPLPLEDGGLPAALAALAERVNGTNGSAVMVRRMETTRRLGPEREAGAFMILREAANNAVKTGRAPHVSLDLYEDDGAVVALVEDDGKGFDVAAVLGSYGTRGSLGLLQMRESARLIGGQLSIDSSVGNGTRIRLRIPVADEH
jgi:signal transduction histidine kinase